MNVDTNAQGFLKFKSLEYYAGDDAETAGPKRDSIGAAFQKNVSRQPSCGRVGRTASCAEWLI